MLVSDYRVFTSNGNGIISFLQDNVIKKVLIPKSNTIAIKIFDRYHDQLSYFKYRYQKVAKWIVRDLRKEGFIFKTIEDYPSIYIPVYENKDNDLTSTEKLHWFYYEMELIKKKLSDIPLENEYVNKEYS